MPRNRIYIAFIILSVLCSGLFAVAVGIGTTVLPDNWKPYLWVAWPLAIIFLLGGIRLAIWQYRLEHGSDTFPDAQDKRNRSRMLEKVKAFWIENILKNSLYGGALIELGMEYRPDAVENPWEMVLQQQDRRNHIDTKITDVFDRVGSELLILGAPGSGKTTMLLELARNLIIRAEQDNEQPIPVVFNLTSWTEKRGSISEWLVDELNSPRYKIDRELGKKWVATDQVLLLLDGLDEVKQDYRQECIDAINSFRQEQNHGLAKIAICSRTADYEALISRLNLQNAVTLQPLTIQQVETYLASTGGELAAVQTLLQHDVTLRELVTSPLMLSIITMSYRGLTVDELSIDSASSEERYRHLFDTYVQRMFERRGISTHYSMEHTIHWLSFLSYEMSIHGITEFLIEKLKLNWLPTKKQRLIYSSVIVLMSILLFSLVGMLLFPIRIVPIVGLFGLLVGWGELSSIDIIDQISWSWSKAKSNLIPILSIGLVLRLLVDLTVRGISGNLFITTLTP